MLLVVTLINVLVRWIQVARNSVHQNFQDYPKHTVPHPDFAISLQRGQLGKKSLSIQLFLHAVMDGRP
jgi:hypothetical protein